MAKEQDELDFLIETIKLRSREDTTGNSNIINSFGENKKLDQLIIMDDVSGVVLMFLKKNLTVSRKFGYNCVYVFHVIVLSCHIWQKIISQTNIFNIFPTSVPYNTVAKIFKVTVFYKVRSMFLHVLFTLIEFSLI